MEEKNKDDIFSKCKEYGFTNEVTLELFNYCHRMNMLEIKFILDVAYIWNEYNVKTYEDLKVYREKRKEFFKLREDVSKLINKELTQYEEAYLDKWIFSLNVNSKDIIRIVEKCENADFNETDRIICALKDRNKI